MIMICALPRWLYTPIHLETTLQSMSIRASDTILVTPTSTSHRWIRPTRFPKSTLWFTSLMTSVRIKRPIWPHFITSESNPWVLADHRYFPPSLKIHKTRLSAKTCLSMDSTRLTLKPLTKQTLKFSFLSLLTRLVSILFGFWTVKYSRSSKTSTMNSKATKTALLRLSIVTNTYGQTRSSQLGSINRSMRF